MKLLETLKHKKHIFDIKLYERKILNDKKTKYGFFGYFIDECSEIPAFVTELKRKKTDYDMDFDSGEIIYAATPKTLKHCVEHLTEIAKENESSNIEYFKEKCLKLAANSTYQEEDWETVISELEQYLKSFNRGSQEHPSQMGE